MIRHTIIDGRLSDSEQTEFERLGIEKIFYTQNQRVQIDASDLYLNGGTLEDSNFSLPFFKFSSPLFVFGEEPYRMNALGQKRQGIDVARRYFGVFVSEGREIVLKSPVVPFVFESDRDWNKHSRMYFFRERVSERIWGEKNLPVAQTVAVTSFKNIPDVYFAVQERGVPLKSMPKYRMVEHLYEVLQDEARQQGYEHVPDSKNRYKDIWAYGLRQKKVLAGGHSYFRRIAR